MIDSETLRKIEQARDLLTGVREELKEYLSALPAGVPERVIEQQAAIGAVNEALRAFPLALVEVKGIWERLGKPEAQRTPRITWNPGRFADYRGTFVGLEAFSISWHSRREDPNYFIRAHLPGVTLEKKDDDLDALKEACEAALEAWLLRITGAS